MNSNFAIRGNSRSLFKRKGILRTFSKCIFCGSSTIGKVRRNFYRCHRCKREWSSRKGNILENAKIGYHQFLLILKLFLLEIPVNQAYKEVGLSYRTMYKVYQLIRLGVYKYIQKKDRVLKRETEMDEAYMVEFNY